MKVTFKDEVLLELYETGKTKDNRYKSFCKNKKFIAGYIRAVKTKCNVDSTADLKLFSFCIMKS